MRILRKREVSAKCGYSMVHIMRLEKAGDFPKKVKLGPNAVGFIEDEVEAWLAERAAERDESK